MIAHRALAAIAFAALTCAAAGRADAAGAPAPPVTLNTNITVEDGTVTLGDLFTGLDDKADTAIANAPKPGHQVRLTAAWLARVAKAYRVDWQPRSPAVETTVRRSAHRIGRTRISQAIGRVLAERGVDSNLSIVLDNPGLSLTLPTTAPATVSVANLAYDRSSGRFSANVLAPDVNDPKASATITGRAVHMVDVPVPIRRIGRGELIHEDDLEWISMPANQVNRNHLTDAGSIVGKSARRSVRPGEPLRMTDVRKPVVVAKNSLVTITFKTDRMQLTAQGRALDDGAKGEAVRVINTKSKTTVTGIATAADTVSVKP
jgi:flagella basal body P-ring formation protein FlgA